MTEYVFTAVGHTIWYIDG